MNDHLATRRRGMAGCALALLLCLGGAQAADSGPRHHAEGAYDAATATYTVVKGDDLAAIAERLGISVAELRTANGLTSDLIQPGQRLVVAAPASAAPQTQYKYTTPIAPGVMVPDQVETSIGTLNLDYGYPDDATTQKVYDNLDSSRALAGLPARHPDRESGQHACTLREFGPVNQTDVIWEDLVDSRTVELTANDNTIYSFVWLDTSKGPLVVEVPPMVLGLIDDFWYRWVADIGITGPDQGKGGKYLILPPGYSGALPEGYFVVRPSTYGTWMPFRSFLVDGSPKPGVESVKANLKIYPLADAANPPEMKFVNASGIPANFVAPGDYTFWSLLNQVIQEEPAGGSDPTTLGLFASIGIEKGKPFEPDERMRKILTDAANIGAVTAGRSPSGFAAKMPTSIRTARGGCPSSAATSSRAHPGWPTWTVPPSSTISPPVSHRPWPRRWWARVHNIPGAPRMPTAIRSRAERTISCACRRIFRSRTSGRSSSTTTRPAP